MVIIDDDDDDDGGDCGCGDDDDDENDEFIYGALTRMSAGSFIESLHCNVICTLTQRHKSNTRHVDV